MPSDNNSTGTTRQQAGHTTQLLVCDTLKQKYNAAFVALAEVGQKSPDLILEYNGVQTQIEVKGRASAASPIAFFEKSARRGQCDSLTLRELAQLYSRGKLSCFQELIDQYRMVDESVGFPGDDGVPNSGKLPPEFNVKSDVELLASLRSYAITCLHNHNNNYFAVYDRNTHGVHLFYTGLGDNVFDAPALPGFSQAILTTYGSSYRGAMRVALKIKLAHTKHSHIPARP